MAYVTGGQVQENPPFTKRISKFFDNVVNFFMHFFITLIPIEMNSQSSNSSGQSSSFRGSGGGSTGRGGSSSWGSGRPGPGGSGGSGGGRFRTLGDINPPTVGGCPGGACGM
ncbi:unnamed protein product [Psylliodes chrysocephalus]|uniref:Glycine-rich protein n=1 Tax=Psylliodes chrysocephalus TaxID=3402493 RepID=A0A9P0D784_9CUCU|nr:unnamed protein product [Psylliodes chrysocephala]